MADRQVTAPWQAAMQDHPITLAALIAGAVITLIGVFMWAGAWAALAAFGFIVFLVALAAAVAG
jgi:hypothetical protein